MYKRKTITLFVALAVFSIAAVGVLAGTDLAGRISIGEDDEADHSADAVITSDEAKAIAEEHTGGTAFSVELENEDGYLVYGVHIEDSDGKYDVKVDAGNGSVLKVDSDD